MKESILSENCGKEIIMKKHERDNSQSHTQILARKNVKKKRNRKYQRKIKRNRIKRKEGRMKERDKETIRNERNGEAQERRDSYTTGSYPEEATRHG